MHLPEAKDLAAARQALAGRVERTPILSAETLDARAGAQLFFKAECLQRTGSFKVRGATNKIRALGPADLARGLITVSAGNAALGAAHAARAVGAPLVVVMPENAVESKLRAVAALGARVEKDGVRNASEAFARLHALIEQHGYTLVHPFDDPLVIAGAGTAAAELLDECPDLECLVVPASGGGLLAGTLVAAQALAPRVEVFGVQPTGADGIVRSLAAGTPTAPPHIDTVADGLTAPKPGALNFEIIRRFAAGVATVPDADILAAMRLLIRELRVIVEPAAATALAGVLADRRFQGRRIGIILSGSNAAPERIREVLA
ncbi:MAG TPA: threonine/serine dehydratase, partial [Polyangia bacterium]|nr:threonine/serine dehydratase [Polyangia bacterium]